MEKIDFKKAFKHLYSPSAKQPEVVEVGPLRFLAVDGEGDPGGEAFQHAVGALYGVAFTAKFARKKAGVEPDYSLGPLEALWWMQGDEPFDPKDRAHWQWTLLMWQPDFISEEDIASAVAEQLAKKPNPMLPTVRLLEFDEGRAVQVMHVGPYSEELPTVERLHAFASQQGLRLRGKHHEIYLGDPRRGDPTKLKTLLRQPVE